MRPAISPTVGSTATGEAASPGDAATDGVRCRIGAGAGGADLPHDASTATHASTEIDGRQRLLNMCFNSTDLA